MKEKSIYICQSCGSISYRWQGKCHECQEWNSFVEEQVTQTPKDNRARLHENIKSGENVVKSLADIKINKEDRTITGISEFDRVMGGGFVPGMFILIGGDPGIGKSTLVLQVCNKMGISGTKCLYVTGEESPTQIKLRGERLGVRSENILIYPEISFEKIINKIKELNPRLVVVDSIQTMITADLSGTPGSVGQIREVAARFMMIAKKMTIPIILVGHVTKEGMIAGPKILEHMVDTVLYFEGDINNRFRILRAVKNRFGSTNEIGVFEMTARGLEDIENPSEIFINSHYENLPGSVIIPSIEGTRPILVELQALVSSTNFGVPRRNSIGVDPNRVSMLLAVIEKHLGLHVGGLDVFLNVVGGVKIFDPAMDVGVIMSICSSLKEKAIHKNHVFMGEVGLTGEVRGISSIESRINEASRLGFKSIVVPGSNKFKTVYDDINFYKINHIKEIMELF